MDFETQPSTTQRRSDVIAQAQVQALFQENAQRRAQLQSSLPTNRDLINKIHTYGFQKI